MDRTIFTMGALILVLLLVVIGTGIEKEELSKELNAYKTMVKRSCNCHPYRSAK